MTPARTILSWLTPADRLSIGLAAVATGGLGLWRLPLGLVPFVSCLGALGLTIVLIDGRRRLIPDLTVLGIALAGLGADLVSGVDLTNRLFAAAGLCAGLLALRHGMTLWCRQSALGLGDVKLVTAAALWLHAGQLPTFLLLSALSGLAEAALRRPHPARIAFGQHLAPWLCLCVLWGPGLAV